MVNNVPIYSSSGIGQIVGYRDLFHERMMPNIRKCVSTLERENLMHLVSNMAEKLVNRPFYNPNYGHGREDIDALRFFLAKTMPSILMKFYCVLTSLSIVQKNSPILIWPHRKTLCYI